MLNDYQQTEIIMVSYFRPTDFQKSVESILENTIHPFHLSIIDNSHGGLDQELNKFKQHSKISIYKNSRNLGKGAAFNKWYPKIMNANRASNLVSIDSDIEVSRSWLLGLQTAYLRIAQNQKPGIIAPLIVNEWRDTFRKQLQRGELIMHNNKDLAITKHHGLYWNRYAAGPLFLINRDFFESVNGYYDKQLYGVDDGKLCAAAHKQKRFIGIASNVVVRHMNDDSTHAYKAWKARNITRDVDHKGHWD